MGDDLMAIVHTCCVPHPPLIIPEVGKGEEKGIQKTIDGYNKVMQKVASYQPDTVIITSPHSIMYTDYIHISPGSHARGDFGQFRARSVKIECDYDKEFVSELCKTCDDRRIAAGTLGERNKRLDHGTMIPLYFLQKYLENFKVVRIGISGLSFIKHYGFGQAIKDVSDKLGRRVVMIASGDLSHKLKEDGPYGYAKEGPEFDQEITDVFRTGHFLKMLTFDYSFCERAAECGLRSFIIMAGSIDGRDVKPTLYSYEGPFGVGYGVAGFEPLGNDDSRHFKEQAEEIERKRLAERKANEDDYVRLARYTIENYIRNGFVPAIPEKLPKDMVDKKAGVFVSLKKDGQLRGCIGTFKPTKKNIAQEIMTNAISACSHDPRFSKVRKSELPKLVYSVDVLGEVTPAQFAELDPQKYGVIIKQKEKRGLLLPNLDGVDTATEQIEIASRKAGIYDEDAPVELFKFEVVRHL